MATEHEVLIVGAGPAGLTLAAELLRREVRPRLIDRRAEWPDAPRALGLQARAMEILDRLGVADEARRLGQWTTAFAVYADGREETVLEHDLARFGTAWEGTLYLHQSHTERLLRERVDALGGAVEMEVSFEGAELDEDGVTARVRHADGRVEAARALFLCGADGGRSDVRDALGIGFEGRDDETWLVADLGGRPDLPRDRAYFCRHPDGNVVLFPYGPGEGWYLVDTEPPAEEPDDPAAEAALRTGLERRLAAATGRPLALGSLGNVSRFTIPQRRASALSKGRGFLLGDAAHVNSPASGRGMNSGIEDAANLGWKLALVLRGSAERALLDTYDAERRTAARRLLAESWVGTRLLEERPAAVHRLLGAAIGIERAVPSLHRAVRRFYTGEMSGCAPAYGRRGVGARWPVLPEHLRASPAGRALLAWCAEPAPGVVLIGPGEGTHAPAAAAALAPLRVARLSPEPGDGPGTAIADPGGVTGAALGGPGAVVVRPDGRLAARAPLDAGAVIEAARQALRLVPAAEPAGRRTAA